MNKDNKLTTEASLTIGDKLRMELVEIRYAIDMAEEALKMRDSVKLKEQVAKLKEDEKAIERKLSNGDIRE